MTIRELHPIGLGTSRYETMEACIRSVGCALEEGYQFIDTAQKYENEADIGRTISGSSVDRDDIFLATKIAEWNLANEDVIETAHASRTRLDVGTIDLLYVHWPGETYEPTETLRAFNELAEEGLMHYVGVANFSIEGIERAQDILDVPVAALQIEMHPLLPQTELCAFADRHDIRIIAHSPFMRGEIFEVPELRAIADEVGLTIAELGIAWIVSKGAIPIPKATGRNHLRENLGAADIEVPSDVIARIDAIVRTRRVVDPPEKAPWNR